MTSRSKVATDPKGFPIADSLVELSSDERKELSTYCVQTTEAAGDVLFSEGDEATTIWFVSHGRLEVFLSGLKWTEVIGVMGPKSTVGGVALLDPGPRSAGARATEETTVWEFDRATFVSLQAANIQLAHRLVHELTRQACHDMRAVNARIETYLRDYDSRYVAHRDADGEIAAEADWGDSDSSGRRAISRLWHTYQD